MAKRMVVDSSVALKWWLEDEEFVVESRDILKKVVAEEIELLVPELWFYEISNGLNVAIRRQIISKKLGLEFVVEELQSIRVTQVPIVFHLLEIFKVAQKYNCTVYDIAYLIIAEQEEIPLVTGDKRFFNVVKGETAFVKYLSDLTQIL